MNTLFISDLDGTLLRPDGSLSRYTAETLNELAAGGLNFTFATARSIYSAGAIMADADIRVPCLLMNGVSVYDLKGRRYVSNEFISAETSAKIIDAFRANDLRCFMYKICAGTLLCCYTKVTDKVMESFAEVRRKRYNKPFRQCASLEDEADGSSVYFTVTGARERLLPVKEAAEKIPGASLAFYKDVYEERWFLEIFSDKASKAGGVRKLREAYGFDRVVAFGDNLNDLPMFEAADVRVAVGNARPEVLAAADFAAPPNSEDGAAKWLRENYLNYR